MRLLSRPWLPLLALFSVAGCSEAEQTAGAPTPIASPAGAPTPIGSPAGLPEGSGFEFYVLALSWSPSYCAAEGEDANRQQCRAKRPYAFVVHGLWPQFERGYPEACRTSEPAVSEETLRSLYDIMPSAGLIRYQWTKHGSCAALKQDQYFEVLRAARETVEVPARFRSLDAALSVDPTVVEAAFMESNPALPADGIAVTCDRRYLREVRLCLTKQLEFRSCPEVDRRACRAAAVTMPPTRGG